MKKNDTYTFIMEFRGGTYCSQLKASDIEKAIATWTNKLIKDRGEIK